MSKKRWRPFSRSYDSNIVINQVMPKDREDDDQSGPGDINADTLPEPLDRIRESLADWAQWVKDAENPYMAPGVKYMNLFNLYRNIALDPHLFALTETIFNRVRETPFNIKTDGENNDEKSKLFKKSWFSKFLRYTIEAESWGFTLIQFLGIKDGTFSGVTQTDRFYVRPDQEGVAKGKWQDDIFKSYVKKPLKDWTMFIEGFTHLGRYNVVAKRFILKREVEQFWAIFNELFTTKKVVVKTKFNNSKHRNNLINLMKKMRFTSSWIIDRDDEIEPLDNTGTGYVSFKDFEESSNYAMSKAYIGSTMVTDDGSSYSQSNVHESNTASFIHSFRIWIEEIINEELLPMMQNLGMDINTETDTFEWELSEKLNVSDWAEILAKLLPHYSIEEEEIEEKTGIKVLEKQEESTSEKKKKIEDMQNQLAELYNLSE